MAAEVLNGIGLEIVSPVGRGGCKSGHLDGPGTGGEGVGDWGQEGDLVQWSRVGWGDPQSRGLAWKEWLLAHAL